MNSKEHTREPSLGGWLPDMVTADTSNVSLSEVGAAPRLRSLRLAEVLSILDMRSRFATSIATKKECNAAVD